MDQENFVAPGKKLHSLMLLQRTKDTDENDTTFNYKTGPGSKVGITAMV